MGRAAAVSAEVLPELGRRLLLGSAEACIYSDRDGLIRLWNPAAERMFGYSGEEAIGQSLDLIVPENQRARHWAGYRQVMQTGQTRYGEGDLLAVPGIRKDGRRISLEFTIMPFYGREGRIDGLLAVLRDVTQRFEELRALRKEKPRGEAMGGSAVSVRD